MNENDNMLLITPELEPRQLPPFFENGVFISDNFSQCDMLLLGMATTASLLLPKFFFRHGYPATEYNANLMTLILAPAASGKGILRQALHMVDFSDHIIAGNTSVSAFLNEFARMNGHALMMETEADVMSKVLRQDSTDYSYILRQAAEHETIRHARDGKNKHRIVIPHPQLSVLLSGTPNQLMPLLRSRENGLTSRFVTYLSKDIEGFDARVFGQNIVENTPDATKIFTDLRNFLQALYEWQQSADHRCEFKLTDEQQEQLTLTFSDWYNIIMEQMQFPFSFDSCIKRLAVAVMRFGLILNAVRLDTDEPFPHEIICTDNDFKTMLLLADKLVHHMVETLFLLPEEDSMIDATLTFTDRITEAQQRRDALLNQLPDEFSTQEIKAIAQKESIPQKTMERWLVSWQKENIVIRKSQGWYQKNLTHSDEVMR